jgi:hypothetical protein
MVTFTYQFERVDGADARSNDYVLKTVSMGEQLGNVMKRRTIRNTAGCNFDHNRACFGGGSCLSHPERTDSTIHHVVSG